MKKKEKRGRLPIGIIVIAMTAVVLAGAIKEEITFVSSICSELNIEGEDNIK